MQVDMFSQPQLGEVDKAFWEFHDANPNVYKKLVQMTRDLKAQGHSKVGMQMLFEVIRWKSMLRTKSNDYKMNNNYGSRYARLIMDNEADLKDIYETRRLKG